MTDLTDLESQVEHLLGDANFAVFSQLQVDDWINRAIEDISIHFPLYYTYEVTTASGVHVYELVTNIKGITSVEYPTGQVPARYLQRKTYTEPNFNLVPGFYDFVKKQSDDSDNPPVIYISDVPPTGAKITCQVASDHAPLMDANDSCTVLARHVHLIALFVRWKAFSERATHDMMDPSPLSTRYSNMAIAVDRAEASYKSALDKAIKAEAESGISSWKMDKYDSIY